jgi:MoaA/NifB/PqqE/SkfB family radical SAM enzyme
MKKLTIKERKKYNKMRRDFDWRQKPNLDSCCNAPYNNMYFTTQGSVSPCWILPGEVDYWTDGRSINDIWFGKEYNILRHNLQRGVFEKKCEVCYHNIKNKVWPLAMAYDRFGVNENGYPTLLELELSNECNLECLMCDGFLSSGIRKNRDKLPKLPMHYNDNFVEQLKEYIPHLKELRFNGGEPFLHKIVYEICMLVSETNPNLQINMATNGVVYNKRVKEILEKCDIRMNISIDGFTKETYEKIRVNSDWVTLMNNFKIFWEYLIEKNCSPSIMVNPMRNNWWEMKEAVRFANKYKCNLWYNTVHHPSHLALHNLPNEKLKDIHIQLKRDLRELKEEDLHYTRENTSQDYLKKRIANIGKFKMFVENQVVGWINEINI